MGKISHILATTFFTGYSPFAPGTAGALVGAALYYFSPFFSGYYLLSLTVIIFFIGVQVATVVEKRLGHDAPEINIDELVGVWCTYLFIPRTHLLFVTIAGFILFRFFDIAKPPPVNQSQKLRKGWGVMTDDLLAGIYANAALRILLKIFM